MDLNIIVRDTFKIISSLFSGAISSGTLKSAGEDIWKLIKKPFIYNKETQDALSKFENNHQNADLQRIVKDKLIDFLKKDNDLVEELEKCIKNFKDIKKDIYQHIHDNTYNDSFVQYGSGSTQTITINKGDTEQPKKP